MSELCLLIVECRYPDDVQDQLLNDQYIFGLCVKKIQGHLLGKIASENTVEKFLLESRKIESKIEQNKPLAIKTNMTYNIIFRGGENPKEIKVDTALIAKVKHVNIVEGPITEAIVQHLARNAKSVVEKTTSKLYVKVKMTNVILVTQDPRREGQRKNIS